MIESPYQILELAKTNRPVDRSELGIDTSKTNDGLELIPYGLFSSQKNHLRNRLMSLKEQIMEEHKCKDCICCCIEQKKCYPQSKDCHSEYDLTEDDIYNTAGRCDFFKAKKDFWCR